MRGEHMRAIYAGSFDPFTNGHLDMVCKAARLFDEVDVCIATNANKRRSYDEAEMSRAIAKTIATQNLDNVKVCICDGLIGEYAKKIGAQYLVRGLRNQVDFGYEENIAEVNKLVHPELETIYLRAENSAISSSMVRELKHHGKDVSAFLPDAVLRVVKGDRRE